MIASVYAYLELQEPNRKAQASEHPGALSFNQFRTFLDMNPFLRTLFLQALNPQMWAIDPTGIPLPKHLINKGTILEIDITSQRQFLYQLRPQDLDLHESNQLDSRFVKTSRNESNTESVSYARKCSAFQLQVKTHVTSVNSRIIGG